MVPTSRSYQVSANPVTVFGHLLFIAVATLVLVWVVKFREGLAFESANKFKIFNDEANIPDMFTLHSWLGMIAICLFGLQFLLGFFSYVFPRAESFSRAAYTPWHTFGGLVIFFFAICTAEMGLLQKFLLLGLFRSQEALIVNFIGLLLFLFAVAVGLSVVLPRGY
ncbi:hypothetical protein CRYUN_Cryun21dG0032500 [Craigia yunnanensis]